MMKLIRIVLLVLCSLVCVSFAHVPNLTAASDLTRIDQEPFHYQTWQQGSFRIAKADGSNVLVELLRPKWWFQGHDVKEGGTVHLSLPEMSVKGLATVLSVDALTADIVAPPTSGELVTGKFTHSNASVVDLFLANSPEQPLGVTPNHPIWSVDRKGWVDAGDLEIGETLKTISGITKLIRHVAREGKHTVYNLEIHKRHTFYVSDVGVLVHNACLSKKAKNKIRNIMNLKDMTGREAASSRGATGGNINKMGVHADKTVGELAELAAKGDKGAEAAIKIIKQAAKKAQKYGGK